MEKKITEEQKAKFKAELQKILDFQEAVFRGKSIEEAAKEFGIKFAR
jgi:hypothetical protein